MKKLSDTYLNEPKTMPINMRWPDELHKKVVNAALKEKISFAEYVRRAVYEKLERGKRKCQ